MILSCYVLSCSVRVSVIGPYRIHVFSTPMIIKFFSIVLGLLVVGDATLENKGEIDQYQSGKGTRSKNNVYIYIYIMGICRQFIPLCLMVMVDLNQWIDDLHFSTLIITDLLAHGQ